MRQLWWLLAALLAASIVPARAGEIYYSNDFESKCDVVYWASAAKVQVDEIGLSTEDPAGGRQCARIVFHVTEGAGWCYFKIPVDVRIAPGKTYVVDARVKYETTGGGHVSFGYSYWHMPPGQPEVQGNTPSAGACSEPGKWCHLQSKDAGQAFREASAQAGYPADCPGRFDALYVHTEGNRAGDKVTVWLDDVQFREANDEDRTRWEKEKHPFDYVAPAYRAVEDAAPWGCCGSLEGYAGRLGLPLEVEAAITARQWARFGFDTSIRPGGMVMAPGDPKAEDYVGKFLDLNHRYGLRVLPSVYLTNYYNRKVPRDQCEAAISRVVPRFRDHSALLAWWMIDEPMPNLDDLENQWLWGKQRFEALDKKHPALGAFCIPDAVAMYSQYTQVSLIDCYPLLRLNGKPAGDPATPARWCELSWQRGGRRIWAVQQAFGELSSWRLPTRPELRLMSFLYLSRGATGFLPYYYTMEPAWMTGYGHNGLVDLFGTPTHMGEEIRDLADTLMPLCPLFLPVRWQEGQKTARATCPAGADKKPVLDVSFLRGKPGGYDLVVVCNRDTEAERKSSLSVVPAKGRQLYDLRSLTRITQRNNAKNRIGGRPAGSAALPVSITAGHLPAGKGSPLKYSGGYFGVDLPPGDAAVFLWGTPQAFAGARATVLSRRVQLERRRFAGLAREAEANGISPKTWEAALAQVDALGKQGRHPEALALLRKTETQVEAALRAVPGRQALVERREQARQALSRAGRALELWVLERWPEAGRSGKVAKMRADEPNLGGCIDALTELARCEHLLDYALLSGKGPAHAAAYADLAALAGQAEAGVAGFLADKRALSLNQEEMRRLSAAVAALQ